LKESRIALTSSTLARFPRRFASLLVAVGAPSAMVDKQLSRETAIKLKGAIVTQKEIEE
jgi:hypothetical protein